MSLFLKKANYKNGKTYLSIVDGFRINGKVKQNVIEKLGYLHDLEKIYSNPIEHFESVVNQMKLDDCYQLPSNLNKDELLNDTDEDELLNIGYIFIKYLYQELEIDKFLKDKQKKLNISYDLNKIFSLLIYSRILYPGSKKDAFDNKNRFFEPFNGFELADVYRSLDYFNSYKEELELLLWNNTKDKYNRNANQTYYDCTNYYFEINYNDEDLVDEEGNILEKGYRKRGPEKNHRPDPIIELGLLMDSTDIPMAYDLFPGNESEKLSLRPIFKRIKSKFGLGRTIIVADRGLNTSDNIFFTNGKNDKENLDGYIYGQSVRGASQEFKDWVLNQDDYVDDITYDKDGKPEMFRQMVFNNDGKLTGYEKKQHIFRHKSRIFPKEIQIKRNGKRNTKVIVDQKQMVYYSQKYADKQKRDRNQMIERAKDIIANPKKYDRITAKGAKSYINNIKFVKSTGEIADGLDLSLKEDLIKEEEKYDGYYSIVTSELNMSDKELRHKYRGLSKIEDTFKVTKTELETRPVYVWTKSHIESHFLTCFIALVIVRLLEKNTENNYSVNQIIESIKKFGCINDFSNIYRFFNKNSVISHLSKKFNIEFNKKRLPREKIKKILKY